MDNGSRLLLALILLTYAALGVLYALYTPPWQVPDEPAHYNYIRAIAEDGVLPVMEAGDYDQAYLDLLRDERFPPDLPIEPLTYEDHQPPLYYLLIAPVYLLFDGALLPLRLVSVALGVALLVIAYGLTCTLFPDRPFLAVATTALVAFLPQHVAMTAGVNNDALAEVIVGTALWMVVRIAKRSYWSLGLALGLAVLTKMTACVVLPVAILAMWLRTRREGRPPGWAAQVGQVLLIAALLAGPWLVRNAAVYGWSDPLGLARHNSVVEGQFRTAELLADCGWSGLIAQFLRTTFQSFWGQFGWMAVPFHPPIYLALLLPTGLLAAGFLGWLLDRRRPRLVPVQADGLRLLAASALLTLVLYLVYNATFVQHQGRYLFPALIPLALGTALGLEWLLSPHVARWAAVGLAGMGVLLVVWGLVYGGLPLVPAGVAFGLAAVIGVAALWPRRGRWLTLAGLAVGLVALDLYALFWAVVPTLAR